MKEIIRELKEFIKKDFNKWAYLYTVVVIIFGIWYNYKYLFELRVLNSFFLKPMGFLTFTLFYILSYLIFVIPVLAIKRQTYKLKQKEFWVKTFVFLGVFGLSVGFYYHYTILNEYRDSFTHREKHYLLKIFGNLKRFVPFLIFFFIIKLIYDRQDKHLYGLGNRDKYNYKPFLMMILIVLPLAIAASTQKDFLITYPRFKFWMYPELFDLSLFEKIFYFELAYGLDFISIEMLFRGALVIGMVRVLGREAILPMAALYVFIHFGKPLGETISSFFGGYILGVHSYYKKNITGGIIIHVGIAYLMELAAIAQHIFK